MWPSVEMFAHHSYKHTHLHDLCMCVCVCVCAMKLAEVDAMLNCVMYVLTISIIMQSGHHQSGN